MEDLDNSHEDLKEQPALTPEQVSSPNTFLIQRLII